MLFFELKKTFGGNVRWILAMLLLLNIFAFYVYMIPVIPTKRQSELREKWEETLEDKSLEEGIELLRKEEEEVYLGIQYLSDDSWMSSKERERAAKRYGEATSVLVDTLREEAVLLSEMQEEYQNVLDYNSFISGLEKRGKDMLKVPVFSKSRFSRRNIEKTLHDFESVKEISVTPVKGKVLERCQNFYLTDMLVIVMICLLCFQEFGYDRRSGMGNLIHATPSGKQKLRFAQMCAVWTATTILVLAFYGSDLLISCVCGEMKHFHAYIQGIGAFRNVSFPCTVGAYLILMLVGKIGGALLIASVCQILAVKFNGEKAAWLLFGAAVGGSFLLWFFIPDSPVLKLFRYLNLVGILDVKQIFGYYQNQNLFSIPVSLSKAAILFVFLTWVICTLGTLYVSRTNVSLPSAVLIRKRKRRNTPVHIFSYECYKLFYCQKVWIVVAVLVLAVFGNLQETTKYISGEEFYYEQYLQEFVGQYTENKAEKIEALFDHVSDMEENEAKGFQKLYEQNQVLSEQYEKSPEKKREKLGFVNLWQMERFFSDKQREFVNMLLVTLSLIFSVSALFYQDREKNMEQLFHSVSLGEKIYRNKMLLAALLGVLYSAIVWCVVYVNYFAQYGIVGTGWQIQCLPEFADTKIAVSIRIYMIITIGLRCMAGAYLGIIIAFFAQMFIIPVQNMICNVLIFVLPLCLSYVGNMGYNNVLVRLIHENLYFFTAHMEVFAGFQRACIRMSICEWSQILLFPVIMLTLGKIKWKCIFKY